VLRLHGESGVWLVGECIALCRHFFGGHVV
jgi:hypothetical protein